MFRGFEDINDGGRRKDKSFTIVEEAPSWEDVEPMNVKRLEFKLNPDLDLTNLQGTMKWTRKYHRETIKKAEEPFAEVSNVL